jgi:hypothetical protein
VLTRGRGERRCFFGWRQLRRLEPSDTSRGARTPGCRSSPFPGRVGSFPPGHVNAPGFPEPEVPSTREDRASLFRELPRSAASLAGEHSCRTCSSTFENDRLDLSPPAFACELEAACAPLASAEQCSCEHDRGPPERPYRRIAVGATAWLDRVAPNPRQSPKQAGGQGPRRNRSSCAPRGDCSSRRLRPDLDRFECLLSRPPLSRPVRSDVGSEGGRHRGARLQGTRATGPCDAELPRRNSTFTSPRHFPSQGRSRTNEGSFTVRASPSGGVADAFFTAEVVRARDARTKP